jgi:hypothetical protein
MMDSLLIVFGETFLRYVLAQEDLQLDQSRLTSEQSATLRALTALALQVQTQPGYARQITAVNAILTYVHGEATTVANTWRLNCGGDIPSASSGDGVLTNLLVLATDIYPALLLAHRERELPVSHAAISGPVLRHPRSEDFCRDILSDPQLKKLFPIAKDIDPDTLTREALLSISSVLTVSLGRSTSLQIALLADTLLASGQLRSLLSAEGLTQVGYVSCVEEVFQELRSLVSTRSANIPAIYGLANIEFPPDTAVNVPWGILRSPRKTDALVLPKAVQVGAVLETTAQVTILDVQMGTDQAVAQSPDSRLNKYRKDIERWSQHVDRPCELLRLSLLLASPPEGFLVAHQASRTILDPLQSRPLMRWAAIGSGTPGAAPTPIAAVSSEALSRVLHWAQKAASHPVKLDIAMRRTLSALADRTDALDGFIDSILAWENLFSGRPETTLRVCGAIAWFLEPNSFGRRTALYNEMTKLYANRSSLVHGSIATIDDPITARDRSVGITLACIRRLYDDNDLLFAKDSSARGLQILMGRRDGPSISETQNC